MDVGEGREQDAEALRPISCLNKIGRKRPLTYQPKVSLGFRPQAASYSLRVSGLRSRQADGEFDTALGRQVTSMDRAVVSGSHQPDDI